MILNIIDMGDRGNEKRCSAHQKSSEMGALTTSQLLIQPSLPHLLPSSLASCPDTTSRSRTRFLWQDSSSNIFLPPPHQLPTANLHVPAFFIITVTREYFTCIIRINNWKARRTTTIDWSLYLSACWWCRRLSRLPARMAGDKLTAKSLLFSNIGLTTPMTCLDDLNIIVELNE